jgi:predicted phage terminase large subunit-like protein
LIGFYGSAEVTERLWPADPPKFLTFARRTLPFELHPWQQRYLCPLIQRLADERGLRVLIHAPPQFGKSILISQRAPAWLLGVDPVHRVGLACYNETHAGSFGAVVRNLMLSPDYLEMFPAVASRVRKDAAEGEFSTTARQALGDAQPSFKAMGLLSGFTGKSCDTLLIDDPYRSAEDARSELVNDRVWRFWKDTASVRLDTSANVVVMFHRYHEDDLAGRLLAEGGWEYYRFPAIADENEDSKDPSNPAMRQAGELLSPMRSRAWLEAQESGNPLTFLGQFQGRPTKPEGLFFKVGMIEVVGAVPADCERVRYWDKAGAKPGKGDWTAGVRMAKDADGYFYIEHVKRGQWPAHERDPEIKQTTALDRASGCTHFYVEQVPGLGKESTDRVVRMLAGYDVHADPVHKEKTERAEGFASQVNAGNVRMVQDTEDDRWNTDFLNELRVFPAGKNDDQVDAASGAFNKLAIPREMEVSTDPQLYESFFNQSEALDALAL